MYNECPGGVTAPEGFTVSGVHSGVKRVKKDLALIASDTPAAAAGVFTTSRVQAAPVLVTKAQLRLGNLMRAVVINSGNANACTGERGLNDAWEMTRLTAEGLGINQDEVLVSSTGVIGQYLPMENIRQGIREAAAALSAGGHADASEAIMTTDTFVKECAVRVSLGGTTVTIGGMAKGSGMIAPNMATMLAFLTTDARISQPLLQHVLASGADRSFNRISVDGDTSTNDMVLALAGGRARHRPLDSPDHPDLPLFAAAFDHVLASLSKMIVLDGEGATKFVEICVRGARSEAAAVQAGKAIANSNLVKTAIHGEDANWGRILAALGASGIDFDPADVEIFLSGVPILGQAYAITLSEESAKEVLRRKEITITVDLHQGSEQASFWTCDLSRDYVTINANYRT